MTNAPRHTVLVIDDEPLLVRVIVRLLTSSFNVVTYECAGAALAYIDSGAPCDAILCDIHLGDMTGITFYERLGESRKDLAARVVFMTGSDATPELEDFLKEHQDRVLLKPFQKEELAAALRHVLPEQPRR